MAWILRLPASRIFTFAVVVNILKIRIFLRLDTKTKVDIRHLVWISIEYASFLRHWYNKFPLYQQKCFLENTTDRYIRKKTLGLWCIKIAFFPITWITCLFFGTKCFGITRIKFPAHVICNINTKNLTVITDKINQFNMS